MNENTPISEMSKVTAEAMMKEVAEAVVADIPAYSTPKVFLLDRNSILGADDLQHEDVEVPEWGGSVRVRGLMGSERDEFEASIVVQDGDGKTHVESKQMRARLVSLTVIDERGARLFSKSDVEALGQKSAAALEKVFDVAMKLAGMSKDEVEKISKDFVETPNGDSSSD